MIILHFKGDIFDCIMSKSTIFERKPTKKSSVWFQKKWDIANWWCEAVLWCFFAELTSLIIIKQICFHYMEIQGKDILSKSILLYFTKGKKVIQLEMTWGWVNDERSFDDDIFSFWWTIPLKCSEGQRDDGADRLKTECKMCMWEAAIKWLYFLFRKL